MQAAIVLYKGNSDNLWYTLIDNLIRLRLFSKYSHAELVLEQKCYSSSMRDKGVRSLYLNYLSDKWDAYYFDMTSEEYEKALNWFDANKGKKYDWRNIISYIIPFVRHSPDKFICFEAIAEMLGIPNASDARPSTLIEYVKKRNEHAQ